MASIARQADGVYVPWSEESFELGLEEISAALGMNDVQMVETEDAFNKPKELYQFPLCAAAILLIIRLFIGERRKMSRAAVALSGLIFFGSTLSATPQWQSDYDKALEAAKSEKKPLMLYFSGSDWNRQSLKMQEEILDKKEFERWSRKRVILLQCDLPRKSIDEKLRQRNRELADKFKAELIPHVVFIDGKEKVIAPYRLHRRRRRQLDRTRRKNSRRQ